MARDLIPATPRGAGGGGGGKGGGGGSQRAPQEAPDSLISTQYARVLSVLCEGEIEGIVNGAQGIFLDDTPLVNPDGSWNFTGAAIDWRTGQAWQAPIPGFSAAESEQNIGVEVTNAAPVVRSSTNPNMTSVRVTLGFPQMTFTDQTTGDLLGTSVTIRIEIQSDGGGFSHIIDNVIEGKATSRYQRSYRISLARFGGAGHAYDVRVSRLTPDNQGAQIANSVQWETMTEIVDSELIYPYSALAGVQVDASTFRAIPKLSFDTRMLRIQIPSNYNPVTREYYGVWDGTFRVAFTDNPAWIFYDIAVTRRYGLGGYLNPQLMDKWTLYDISQYCDGLVPDGFGGQEPRYTCNVYIQERSDAIAVMQQFASIFNGMLFWSGGALTVAADRPADAVMAFTPANVIDGEFGYVGTPLNQRHTVALVTWNNPANRYEQEIEYVESDSESINQFGIREAEVLAFGCTSRGLAHRIGRGILLTEQMLSETVSFKTGVNAAFLRPGDVFTTTDPTRAGARNGGRILGGDASTVFLDAPVTLTAGASYRLSVMLPDGRLETRDVALNLAGETSQITVTAAFSLPVSRMGVWSLWASNMQSELWRCLSLAEDEEGNIQINGVMYNASKFDAIEQGLALEIPDTSIIDPFNIAPPSELNLTESLYQISPVIIGARVTFSWLAPVGAVRFQVAYQSATGSPVVEETGMNSIDVQPVTPGQWFFTVWAVNSLGIMSRPASIQRELFGLNRPPQDVQQFQLDIINDSANLTWQLATDLDVLVGGQIIIRYSPRMTSLVTWEEASEIARFAGSQSNGFVPLMKGVYLAKFENSSGWLSATGAIIVSTVGPLRDMNVVAELPQQPDFPGEHVNTVVRYGVLYVQTTPEGMSVSTDAEYYFDQVVDMGKVYTVYCKAWLDGAVYDLFDDVDTWPDWDARPDVDGTKINEGGAIIQAQITNVNPLTATDDDWSPWLRLVAADLTFRAVRFRLMIRLDDTTHGMGIFELAVSVDVPDRVESANNTPIPVSGYDVRFAVPFKTVPAIAIIAQDLQTGDRWDITNQNASGFHIAFRNSAGAYVAKTCDWIARGYGYEHEDLEGIGWLNLHLGGDQSLLEQRRVLLASQARKG